MDRFTTLQMALAISARGPLDFLHRLRGHRRRRRRDRRVGNAGCRVDVGLVKALVDEKLSDDRVQLLAVLFEQPARFGITLVGDAPNLFVNRIEEAVRDPRHARIAFRGQHGKRADARGHPPSADHGPGDAGDRLQVVTILKISCSAAIPPSAPMIRPRR